MNTPTNLPPNARSFRIYIDDQYGNRMIISDWITDVIFWRFREDFLPLLARAGTIGFIASTLGAFDDRPRPFTGRPMPNEIVWWWDGGEWIRP